MEIIFFPLRFQCTTRRTAELHPDMYTKSEVVCPYIHYHSAVPLQLNFLFRDRARLVEDTQKEHILSGL